MRNVFLITLITFFTLTNLRSQQSEEPLEIQGMHDIYPVGEKGVILMDRSLNQMNDGSITIGFTGYDASLKKKWKNYYPIRKGMTLAFRKVDEQGIHLLFASKDRKKYELIKGDTEYGDYEVSRYTFSEPFRVAELEAFYDQIWLAGIIGAHPVVFKLNPEEGAYQTVPVGIPGRLKYVGQLHYNKPTKSLDYVMLAEVDNREVAIWRSITPEGKVLINEKLTFGKNKPTGLKTARLSDGNLAIAGQYIVGQRDKIEGLFNGVIGESMNLEFRSFKKTKAISSYKRFRDIDRKNFESAKAVKFNKANKRVFIDHLGVNDEGELEITLEVYTDNFQVRGTLEKQIITRDRRAQLDQNTYGRRTAFSGTDESEDLEDLMARGSATDQLQYRYMEQSLSKALAGGMVYSHTGYLRFSPTMELVEETSVFFDLKDQGRLITQDNYKGGAFRYFNKGSVLTFETNTKQATNTELVKDLGTQLLPWYDKTILGVSFNNEGKGFTLYRFSLD